MAQLALAFILLLGVYESLCEMQRVYRWSQSQNCDGRANRIRLLGLRGDDD